MQLRYKSRVTDPRYTLDGIRKRTAYALIDLCVEYDNMITHIPLNSGIMAIRDTATESVPSYQVAHALSNVPSRKCPWYVPRRHICPWTTGMVFILHQNRVNLVAVYCCNLPISQSRSGRWEMRIPVDFFPWLPISEESPRSLPRISQAGTP